MAGFIVLEDGRAYSASGWATDAALRAIACSIEDEALRTWLLSQQQTVVPMGITMVDLRALAPQNRAVVHTAIRDAHRRIEADGQFEDLVREEELGAAWIHRLGQLVKMVDLVEAGEPPEQFNPHMRGLLDATGDRVGPGWDAAHDADPS